MAEINLNLQSFNLKDLIGHFLCRLYANKKVVILKGKEKKKGKENLWKRDGINEVFYKKLFKNVSEIFYFINITLLDNIQNKQLLNYKI